MVTSGMNWRRFLGLEKRQAAPYSDAIVQALQDRATGVAPRTLDGVGALEIAAGLWARGLASATISPASPVTSALSPAVMASMGRGLGSAWGIPFRLGRERRRSENAGGVFMGCFRRP